MTGKLTDQEIRAALDGAVRQLSHMSGTIPRTQLADELRKLVHGMLGIPLEALTVHDLPKGERIVQVNWLRATYGLSLAEVARVLNRIKTARLQEIEDHIRSEQ